MTEGKQVNDGKRTKKEGKKTGDETKGLGEREDTNRRSEGKWDKWLRRNKCE